MRSTVVDAFTAALTMPAPLTAPGDTHGSRWTATQPAATTAGDRGPSETGRMRTLFDWMWEHLSNNWAAWVPIGAHTAWQTMLTNRDVTSTGAAAVALGDHPLTPAVVAVADALAYSSCRCAGITVTTYTVDDEIAATAVAEAVSTVLNLTADPTAAWRNADPAEVLTSLL